MKFTKEFLILILSYLTVRGSATNVDDTEDEYNISPEESPDNKYMSYLLKAQEEAKCLQEYGTREVNDGKYVCSKIYPLFPECNQCRNLTEEIGRKSCKQICNSDLKCQRRCLDLDNKFKNPQKIDFLSINAFGNSVISLHPPRLFCEDASINEIKSEDKFHIIVIKWDINFMNETSQNIPIVFVLELMELSNSSSKSRWSTTGKTTDNYLIINIPYETKTYKWRVTAVGPNGPMERAVSKTIITTNGFVKPGNPKRIYIAKQIIKEESMDVLIAWEPPDDKPCYYRVENHETDDGRLKILRLSATDLVHQEHSAWFYNLHFDKTYDIGITSRRGTWDGYQSNITSATFKLMSCREAHNHSFTKCPPPPPTNLRQDKVNLVKMPNGKEKGLVKIHWTPPQFTSSSNSVKSYTLFIGKPFNSTHGNNSTPHHSQFPMLDLSKMATKLEIPGDSTQYVLKNLNLSSSYSIALMANSVKGSSVPVFFTVSTHYTRDLEGSVIFFPFWAYILFVFSIIFIGITIFHYVWAWKKRRNHKKERDHYFQSIEEQDASFDEFSMVPLNEDSGSIKLFNDLSKEKWEIPYENLKVEDIIGQGAFGVVRRAQLCNKNIDNKNGKKRSNRGTIIAPLNNTNENQTKVVAVKQLKVSATRGERDELIKEIITMHNLSGHPQIVNLLGVCMKRKSLCLVMEYCPGGDLLSFLRKNGHNPDVVGIYVSINPQTKVESFLFHLVEVKAEYKNTHSTQVEQWKWIYRVRAKYWPTLGLTNTKMENKNLQKTSESTTIHIHQEVCSASENNIQPEDKENPSIKYAELESFSKSSDELMNPNLSNLVELEQQNSTQSSFTSVQSTTKLMRSNSCINNNNTNESFDNSDCRPVDERDILSYARQVSMGMEYLEKHKIIHRDLAARNVLLLGDYKQVKISDFGLSRDIYNWNVYHQQTDGKLPVKWMAIESIFDHIYTTKSDVWSYGILLWELVTLGGSPYPGVANNELFHQLKSGFRMERPENCSEEFYALMEKCWKVLPSCRPSFTEIRRFVEDMLESVEPSMYLSLTADLPSNYFQLSSKSDLLLIESPPEKHEPEPKKDFDDLIPCSSIRKLSNAYLAPKQRDTGQENNPTSNIEIFDDAENHFQSLATDSCTSKSHFQHKRLVRRKSAQQPAHYHERSQQSSSSLRRSTSSVQAGSFELDNPSEENSETETDIHLSDVKDESLDPKNNKALQESLCTLSSNGKSFGIVENQTYGFPNL